MRAMLHGFRRVDMKNENDQPIKGFSCFIGYPADGVEGQEVTKVFVSDNICLSSGFSPRVGDVELEFTPKGRVSSVRMINSK